MKNLSIADTTKRSCLAGKSHILSERVLTIDPEMLRCQIRCNDVFGPRSAAKSLIQPDIKTKKGIQLSTAIHPENDKPSTVHTQRKK